MSVTAPLGFVASGVDAGLTSGDRPDLGLLVSDGPASAAALFTSNQLPAAPVIVSRRHVADGRVRAVVVNAGHANAGTGEAGIADSAATAALTAETLGVRETDVLVCSTGLIGARVPLDRIAAAIPEAVRGLGQDEGPVFARAILTTDAGPKESMVEADGFRVGGCVKGAGMIAPDLGTMLAFITTDVVIDPPLLRDVVRRTVGPRFNGLTVDGCTSTNDTVIVLAGGASEVRADPGSPAFARLEEALAEVSTDLVRQVAAGAEGATRVLAVEVTGAGSDEEARVIGLAAAGSLLVKTAVFGGDPNVGRLLQAVGGSGVGLDPEEVEIWLAGETVVARGAVVPFDVTACRAALKEAEVAIRVCVGAGPGRFTGFGCDLGYEYVRLNAEYTT